MSPKPEHSSVALSPTIALDGDHRGLAGKPMLAATDVISETFRRYFSLVNWHRVWQVIILRCCHEFHILLEYCRAFTGSHVHSILRAVQNTYNRFWSGLGKLACYIKCPSTYSQIAKTIPSQTSDLWLGTNFER